MARKRQVFQQKLRTREHVVADLAVNHVERQVLLCGYSVEKIVHDYGLDLILFTYNSEGELEDGSIFLQVKGSDNLEILRSTQDVAFRVTRADLQTWLHRTMPVILILIDMQADVGYWLYVQQYFSQLSGFDLFAAGNTVTVRIPRTQVLDTNGVRQFAGFRDKVLGQIGSVHHD